MFLVVRVPVPVVANGAVTVGAHPVLRFLGHQASPLAVAACALRAEFVSRQKMEAERWNCGGSRARKRRGGGSGLIGPLNITGRKGARWGAAFVSYGMHFDRECSDRSALMCGVTRAALQWRRLQVCGPRGPDSFLNAFIWTAGCWRGQFIKGKSRMALKRFGGKGRSSVSHCWGGTETRCAPLCWAGCGRTVGKLWPLLCSVSFQSRHRRIPREQHDGCGRHTAPRGWKRWILTSESQSVGSSVWLVLLCSPLPWRPGSSHHWASTVVVLHVTPQTAQSERQRSVWLLPSLTSWLLHLWKWLRRKCYFWTPLCWKNIMEERLVVCCNEASRCGDSTNEAVSCFFSPEMCLSLVLSW